MPGLPFPHFHRRRIFSGTFLRRGPRLFLARGTGGTEEVFSGATDGAGESSWIFGRKNLAGRQRVSQPGSATKSSRLSNRLGSTPRWQTCHQRLSFHRPVRCWEHCCRCMMNSCPIMLLALIYMTLNWQKLQHCFWVFPPSSVLSSRHFFRRKTSHAGVFSCEWNMTFEGKHLDQLRRFPRC